LLGWAGNKGVAALEVKQLLAANKAMPYHLGIISQTTQSQSAFVKFIIQLIAALPSVMASPSLPVILREPFACCHSEPFTPCHSERSEESNPAQGKLREESDTAQDKLRDRRISSSVPSYRQDSELRLTRINSAKYLSQVRLLNMPIS